MKIVSYKEWNDEKIKFMEKHNFDYTVETSSMNEYGEYHKVYVFEDGANWYENMRPVWEKATVEVKRVPCTVEIKLLETEFYSSEDAQSKYYYERF